MKLSSTASLTALIALASTTVVAVPAPPRQANGLAKHVGAPAAAALAGPAQTLALPQARELGEDSEDLATREPRRGHRGHGRGRIGAAVVGAGAPAPEARESLEDEDLMEREPRRTSHRHGHSRGSGQLSAPAAAGTEQIPAPPGAREFEDEESVEREPRRGGSDALARRNLAQAAVVGGAAPAFAPHARELEEDLIEREPRRGRGRGRGRGRSSALARNLGAVVGEAAQAFAPQAREFEPGLIL